MGTQRASNKDILEAIQGLTQAITASMVAPAPTPDIPVLEAQPNILPMAHERKAPAPVIKPVQSGESSVQVPEQYLNHMGTKVQALVTGDGQDRILYTRKNLRGEVKLAYCLASKWTGLRDKGLIGAVKHLSAS